MKDILRKPALILATAIAMLYGLMSTGCSSGKSTQSTPYPTEAPADIALQTPQQRYSALCQSYGEWFDVSMPVKLSLRSPKRLSLSAKAEMKHGQWIYMSVRMLGFEVASIWVDNDSIHAIDRYHKAYLSESLHRLFGNSGATISDVQNLILGRGFILGNNGGMLTPELETKVKTEGSATELLLLPSEQPAGIEYGFIMSPSENNIAAASVSIGEKYAATIKYSSFITTSHSGVFASSADFDMVKGKKIAASLNWDFTSAKWNTDLKRQWKLPSGYSRMSADKILKALTNL